MKIERTSGRSVPRTVITLAVLMLLGLSGFVSCGRESFDDEKHIQSKYANAAYLNQVAAFISGLAVAPDSPFYAQSQNKQYASYKEQADKAWTQYDQVKFQKIVAWRDKYIRSDISTTVFYPFSGPDILNALNFFPDGEDFTMIGLESFGEVPDPRNMPADKVAANLNGVMHALRTLLNLNFFRTSEMMGDVKAESFSSITGLMMCFLARFKYEILDVHKVYVNGEGKLVENETKGKNGDVPGIEIVFRKGKGQPLRRARFFKIDVSDNALKKTPHFVVYLKKQTGVTTFMKSASYLLSWDNFTTMRGVVLGVSDYIVQDDSGCPMKYFGEKEWKLTFHGTYTLLQMFANQLQPDLQKAMKEKSTGPLPFAFGYGFNPDRSSIIIAEKIARQGQPARK
ncbi:MAG: hypothetical protein EPN93_11200 [Spirochaetes bacterium]|nr:MAG: hypothetical protein EPN93_11200 [Spirochaetota bacterium]